MNNAKFENLTSKLAAIASKLDAAGLNAAAIKVDDLLLRTAEVLGNMKEELEKEQEAEAGFDPPAEPTGVDIVTDSGVSPVRSEEDIKKLIQGRVASKSDVVAAAESHAYRLGSVEKMANLRSTKDKFATAIQYMRAENLIS